MNAADTAMGVTEVLSAESRARIDREVAKYPAEQKQSAVMSALAIAQDQHGWLATATMDAVADYLGMPPIAVYEVASFYAMYNIAPVGRFKLTVCTNLPCALSGGEHAAVHLRQKLGIGFNETTADGLFTLKEGECMGACGDAPVLLVNNKRMCSFMNDARLDELIDDLRAGRVHGAPLPTAATPAADVEAQHAQDDHAGANAAKDGS